MSYINAFPTSCILKGSLVVPVKEILPRGFDVDPYNRVFTFSQTVSAKDKPFKNPMKNLSYPFPTPFTLLLNSRLCGADHVIIYYWI